MYLVIVLQLSQDARSNKHRIKYCFMCPYLKKERSSKGLWCVNTNPFHLWSIGVARSYCNKNFEYLSNSSSI